MLGNPATWFRRPAAAVAPTAPQAAALHPAEPGWQLREGTAMGTLIRAELWSTDPASGSAALDAVMAEMQRVDQRFSPHRADSELSVVNRDAQDGTALLSPELNRLVTKALAFSARSGGAFDISYASVGQHYDYRAGTGPDEATRERARTAIGWQHLIHDAQARTLRFGRPGMRIDLGGFAKGHAVDNAVALLRRRGIQHACVAAGGDSHLIGDRRGRPWQIAVRDPRAPDGLAALLPLADTAIATSGDYERCYDDAQGVRHHHILDPRTGRSATGVRSVTILADDGLTAEAWSKTVFVLGRERGLALLAGQPGIDAIVVDDQGRLHVSPGLDHAGTAALSGEPR